MNHAIHHLAFLANLPISALPTEVCLSLQNSVRNLSEDDKANFEQMKSQYAYQFSTQWVGGPNVGTPDLDREHLLLTDNTSI